MDYNNATIKKLSSLFSLRRPYDDAPPSILRAVRTTDSFLYLKGLSRLNWASTAHLLSQIAISTKHIDPMLLYPLLPNNLSPYDSIESGNCVDVLNELI